MIVVTIQRTIAKPIHDCDYMLGSMAEPSGICNSTISLWGVDIAGTLKKHKQKAKTICPKK